MNIFRFISGRLKARRAACERRQLRENYSGVAVEILRADWPQSLSDPTAFYIRCCHYFDRNLPEALRRHRDYFSRDGRGFGEDAFHTLWFLLFREFRPSSFLEIGVFRGQSLSLAALLAREFKLDCFVQGVSPFSLAGDAVSKYRRDVDYYSDTGKNFSHFSLPAPSLLKAYSTDPEAVTLIASRAWDIIYIDGCHDYEVARQDWDLCAKNLASGGLIVLDDASLHTDFRPPAFATAGHPGPSRLAAEISRPPFAEILRVGHNRVFQKNRLKIAILTTDSREHFREYDRPTPYFGTAPEALLQGFAQMPGVEVHVVSCTQRPLQSPGKIAPNIFYHGLHVPKIGWQRTLYQGNIRTTRKKLKELQPDIVHGQGTERDCSLAAIFSGFPNVLTVHGNMRLVAKVEDAPPFSYWWNAARLEAFALPRTDGVVCITNYTREAVAPLAPKTWLVPNAVDGSFFGVRSGTGTGAPTMLCVGFICLRKNQNAFIRALDPLAAQRKFRLVFLGGVSRDNTYGREFFELLRTRPWCEHHGFVNRDRLKEWLGGATLLALPSIEDNCPMTVLEAAAAGVPVVAANVGGVPDLVEDGRTGLLCDPLDAASMGGAVGKILEQPELARVLAVEANRQSKERFHPAVIARRHVEIYREVLGREPDKISR